MNYPNIFKFIIIISFIGTFGAFIIVSNLKTNIIETGKIMQKIDKLDKIDNLKVLNKNQQQCIISSKNKKSYCASEMSLFLENEYFNEKKLITISPGGFKGFYLLGILTYIKQNYNIDNYIFSGASAGAWNGLFMCYKGDPLTFVYNLLDRNILKAKSITELQYLLKYKLLSTCREDDFDLKKLFIGVTTFKNIIPKCNIYSDFEDMEDVINCCMASSHIPLVTGGITNKYKNMYSLDGGFSKYPYLIKERILHIEPQMWENLKEKNEKSKQNSLEQKNINNFNIKRSIKLFKKYSELFSISKNNLLELFDDGFQDAKNHKEYFDNIFEFKKNISKSNLVQDIILNENNSDIIEF